MLRTKVYKYAVIIIALALFVGSCSGGDLPTLPGGIGTSSSHRAGSVQTHRCLGYYVILINEDRTVWDVLPLRTGMAHLSILPLLEGPTDFLTIPEDGIVFEEEYIAATIQIEHPLKSVGDFDANEFMGFDVKGIIMFPGTLEFPTTGIRTPNRYNGEGYVLNPDGYSRWWNPLEFSEGQFLEKYVEGKLAIPKGGTPLIDANLHPFKFFYPPKNKPRQAFPAEKIAQTTYHLILPEMGKPFALMYAIDASYGPPTLNEPEEVIRPWHFEVTANQPEPYGIQISTMLNDMYGDNIYEGGGECYLEINIRDWQDATRFNKIFNPDGVRSVYIDAPDLAPDLVYLEPDLDCDTCYAEAKTKEPVIEGALEADSIIINDVTIPYAATLEGNNHYDNAKHIAAAINISTVEHDVGVVAIANGTLLLRQTEPGKDHRIKIHDTPNLTILGLDTIGTYMEEPDPPPPGYYEVKIDFRAWIWTGKIINTLAITPGIYPALIVAVDHEKDELFPSEDNWPSAYWVFYIEVVEEIPFLCEGNMNVHSIDLGTGTIANAKIEYKADCDFIGYPSSPYLGRLLFNKGSDLPDGVQEICVMHADIPQVASALPIITIDDETMGIPLILQEDDYSGNIILVNHTNQDEVFVFNSLGELENAFDYGDGDDGYNSPIAVDFDETGMWVISHRGSAGPELRHWYNPSGGNYINIEADRVDLTPIYGVWYTIYDLKVMPTEGLLVIFSWGHQGQIEFFDISKVPPEHLTDRTILNLFDAPLAPAGYPGYRMTVGGDLMLDRAGSLEATRCRIVAAANLKTGQVGLAKFDFYGNVLDKSTLPNWVLCLAMNNHSKEHMRHIVAFPLAETNHYRIFGTPAAGW